MDTYEKKYNEALEKAKNIYKEGVGMDVIQYLFPELAESEDERVRKEMIEFFQCSMYCDDLDTDKIKRWIAYLERQKEQVMDESDKVAAAYQLGRSDERKQKEQKHVDDSDFKTKLAEYMTKNRTGYSYNISSESILQMAKEELIKRGELKEQKPAEWSDYKDKVNVPYCSSEPEWSEEDEDMIRDIIASIDTKIPASDFQEMENWLKSLRPSWKPSEEQPKFRIGDTIHKKGENTVFPMTIERISGGDYVCDGGKCFVSIKFQDNYELIQQKPVAWSEEDKKILDDVSHILIGLNYKQIAKDYKQAVEKLIYARPSWKPSEEQIYSLGTVVKGAGDVSVGSVGYDLKELYEHLKKL